MKNLVIAIDGPAGSGKSTVAKLVAEKLAFLYVDTGAMYRALTLKAIKEKIPLTAEVKLVGMAKKTKIEFYRTACATRVLLDGEDVSDAIRTEEVSKSTHHIASILAVREILWDIQRSYRKTHNIVMEGRDIGSKVFPDAQVKIFLDASEKERAKRRHLQLKGMGLESDINKITFDMQERDRTDANRKIAPLKKLPEAFVIDTTCLTIEQVVDKIIALAKKSLPGTPDGILAQK